MDKKLEIERPNPPIKISEQQTLSSSHEEEKKFIESVQGNYEEQGTSNDENRHCLCLRNRLGQLWLLLIHASAGVLNILDFTLIKIVNRFYYHNI